MYKELNGWDEVHPVEEQDTLSPQPVHNFQFCGEGIRRFFFHYFCTEKTRALVVVVVVVEVDRVLGSRYSIKRAVEGM